MADYVTLLGAEDVARAGRNMASAAGDMQAAAGNVQHAVFELARVLENDRLSRSSDMHEFVAALREDRTERERAMSEHRSWLAQHALEEHRRRMGGGAL